MNELMEILDELRPDVDFENETGLIANGILDSFDIVSLVTALNDAFDIEIKPNDLVPENFNSATAMLALVEKLRERIPGLVLRTSVITGLPGEGEEEFAELCSFLKEMKLERVGAFPFSPEEGTPAAAMDYPDSEVAQRRAQMVEQIQSVIMDEYNEAMIGKEMQVLVDGYDEEFEQYFGRTYADSPEIDGRVWIASEDDISEGDFVTVCIDGLIDGDLSGYIVEEDV